MRTSPAGTAVGALSVGLGSLALGLPGPTATALGLNAAANPALPLLVRMIGIRNTTMGLGLLTATAQEDRRRALQLGLAVGVADVTAVLLATRTRVLDTRAALVAVGMLGGIAVLGVLALQQEG